MCRLLMAERLELSHEPDARERVGESEGHSPSRIRQLRAPHSGRVEFAITRWLSEAFQDVVPQVIACDAGRRWLLMQACAGVLLEGVPDITAWARAARRYGQLQVACAVRGDVLQRLGCRVRALASLVPR
jgi:hypothetical protein